MDIKGATTPVLLPDTLTCCVAILKDGVNIKE